MSLIPQVEMIKVGAIVAVTAVLCLITFFETKQHYQTQYVQLTAEIKQASADQAIKVAQQNLIEKNATQEAYNAIQTSNAAYVDTVADLSKRLQQRPTGSPIIVSSPGGVTCKSPDRPAVGPANPVTPGPVGPTSTLDTEILRDDLNIAISNAKALKAINEWGRAN
jgi:hypothetical protein